MEFQPGRDRSESVYQLTGAQMAQLYLNDELFMADHNGSFAYDTSNDKFMFYPSNKQAEAEFLKVCGNP